MKCRKPFSHLFTTPEKRYLYDVNRNVIVTVSDQAYDRLKEEFENGQWDDNTSLQRLEDHPEINRFLKERLLQPSRIKKILHPDDYAVEYHLNNKISQFTLQVTQQCNLRCDYCVYSGEYGANRTHSAKCMNIETAKKGIDFYIGRTRDTGNLAVSFYGGEPLLEFSLIKNIITYGNQRAEGKKITYNLTTNGTLINQKIIEFFLLHKVRMLISLDGPAATHNKNRRFAFNNCGTFDTVMKNIEFIKTHYPEYKEYVSFNVVIDQRNNLECTNDFFCDSSVVGDFYERIDGQFEEYGKNISPEQSEAFNTVWQYELFKMFLEKLGRLKPGTCSPLTNQHFGNIVKTNEYLTEDFSILETTHHGGPCLPGAQRLFMNVDGALYPCERLNETSAPFQIGHVDHGFDLEKIHTLMNVGVLSEKQCKQCWAIRLCHLCAKHADGGDCLSGEKKIRHCGETHNLVEEQLMDYCTLKEFGLDFDKENKKEYESILDLLHITPFEKGSENEKTCRCLSV